LLHNYNSLPAVLACAEGLGPSFSDIALLYFSELTSTSS